jgi:hypothetical protein
VVDCTMLLTNYSACLWGGYVAASKIVKGPSFKKKEACACNTLLHYSGVVSTVYSCPLVCMYTGE